MLGRKVIYVRCINCSYNNVAKGIRLLDKKHFCLYRTNFIQVRAFERYIPINETSYENFLSHRCNATIPVSDALYPGFRNLPM